MAADRKEYMRQYRAAQKLRAVPELVTPVPEQTELHEHVREPARTGEHLAAEGVHAPVTEPVTPVRVTVTNSSRNTVTPARTVTNTAVTVFSRPLSVYLSTSLLAVFIVVNTAFLIGEQVNFYEIKGGGLAYSLFVATLTECAALALSFFGTWYRRPILFALLIPTLSLIFSVIFLGLSRKEGIEQNSAKITALLEDEINGLKQQAAAFEKQIADGKNVSGSLQKIQARLVEKQEELRKTIVPAGSAMEIWVLAALRIMAILWNIAFASLIAFIWKGPNKTRLFPDELPQM